MKLCSLTRKCAATSLLLASALAASLPLGVLVFSRTSAPAAEPPLFSPLPNQPGLELTNGIILVSPTKLNFGRVPVGKSATNTFLVENFGHGKLTGKVSVPKPFKIISGESYSLTPKEVQVVTIVYAPERVRNVRATVKFTGGNGAKATVTGEAVKE